RLVREGNPVGDVMELVLANSRTPHLRRGDLRAQAAANAVAERRLRELAERRGLETVRVAFHEVVAHSERISRHIVAALPDGTYRAEGEIEGDGVTDEDIPIRVQVGIDGDHITIDFTGTSEAVAGNVNCPLAVTRSACYFA